MTLTQLRAFYLAATLGSFTAAAEAMGTTQPTISELVHKIEAGSGLQLFVRAGRRLVLTSAGSELLPWAQRAVEDAAGASRALTSLRAMSGGIVSFGVLQNSDYYFLSDLAEAFHDAYPGVSIRLVGQNSFEVADAVRHGELEAGLVCLPIPDEGLTVQPIMRQPIVWASADPERTRRPLPIEDIPGAPLILYDAHHGWNDPTRRQLAERAQIAGVKLQPLIEVETVQGAVNLVARGLGDTMVPLAVALAETFPDCVRTVPFAEPLSDTFALVQREGWALSPGTDLLAKMAIRKLLEGAVDLRRRASQPAEDLRESIRRIDEETNPPVPASVD